MVLVPLVLSVLAMVCYRWGSLFVSSLCSVCMAVLSLSCSSVVVLLSMGGLWFRVVLGLVGSGLCRWRVLSDLRAVSDIGPR